jgi:predicted dehydrogenase
VTGPVRLVPLTSGRYLGVGRVFLYLGFMGADESMTHARNGSVPTDDLQVGLVGLGYWGPNLQRVFSELPGVSVRWICDLDPDRLKRFSRRTPEARTTTSFDDLLDDRSLDAILIATPVYTHYEFAQQSLAVGKHTYVEKPIASSSEQADELLRMAEDKGLALMCGHTFTYSPPVRAVKEILDRGELGRPYFITSSRVNLGLHQRDVSVLWDLGPHDFSILRFWLDEMPESVTAIGRDSVVAGIPDVAFVTLRYPSGLLVNLEMSWLAPSKLRRTVVVGSDKMVVYEDSSSEPVRVFDHGVVYRDPETFGEYHLSYRTGEIVSPRVSNEEPLAIQARDFVEAVTNGRAPDGHAELCRDVVRLIEAAELSLANEGMPVQLERSTAPAVR